MTIDFPRAQFSLLGNCLREAKRVSAREVITQQFKLTIRDCISGTPPFDKAGFGKFGGGQDGVSLKDHRITGENAVLRDIGRVFAPFKSIRIARGRNRVAVMLRRYAAEGNLHAILKILREFGYPVTQIIHGNPQALLALHDARRDGRGRVKARSERVVVLNQQGLKDYTSEKVDHVGQAKAGWAELARIAGLGGLQEWITKHSVASPLFDDKREHPEFPHVNFGNLVEFVDDFAQLNILPEVFKNRIASMKTDLDKAIQRESERKLSRLKA